MDAYIPSESGTHKRPALFASLSLPVHYMSSNERYFISISYRDKTFFFKYSTFCRNKSGLKFFFWRFTSMTTARFFSSFKATMSISFCPSFNSHQEPMSRYNSLFPPRNDGAQSSWTRSGWNCPWFHTGWLVFLPLPGWDAGGLPHYNLPWAVSAGLQRSFLPIIQLWTGH